MSERGIEIHNGQVVFPEGMPQEFHLGTEASPLTQGEASQIVVSAVINAVALGGTVKAGLFVVTATVNLTGNLWAIHSRADIAAGITVTGDIYANRIQSDIHDGSTLTGEWDGLRINQYAHSGATISGALYSIHINNYIQSQPVMDSAFIRGSENGGITMHTLVLFTIGGGGDCEYTMQFSGTPITAWSPSLNPPGGAHGRLRVLVHSEERWIQLYLPS